MPNEKKKRVKKTEPCQIVFHIPAEQHNEMTDAIDEINKDERYDKSIRSFCKTALETLIKDYRKIFGLKETK